MWRLHQSVDSSLEPQFGSISEDLLEQFVLEDDWYFSDDEEESSDSEDSVATEDQANTKISSFTRRYVC